MASNITYNGTTLAGSGFQMVTSGGDERSFDTYGFAYRTRTIGNTTWSGWGSALTLPNDSVSFSYNIAIPINTEIQVARLHQYNYGDGFVEEYIDFSNIFQYGGVTTLQVTASFTGLTGFDGSVTIVPVTLSISADIQGVSSMGATATILEANGLSVETVDMQGQTSFSASIILPDVLTVETILINATSDFSANPSIVSYKLKGYIRKDGQPIPNASVFVVTDDGAKHYKTVTDNSGYYEINIIPTDQHHSFVVYKDSSNNVVCSEVKTYISLVS